MKYILEVQSVWEVKFAISINEIFTCVHICMYVYIYIYIYIYIYVCMYMYIQGVTEKAPTEQIVLFLIKNGVEKS